jgi:hypothetical protein
MPMFDYAVIQEKIEQIDDDSVRKHNTKFPVNHDYHLRTDLKPCPFEGNLEQAKVILLLANPSCSDQSTEADHKPIIGWGIWGLSSDANESMRGWWRPRLRQFVKDENDEEEWRSLSHKVASFQAIGWASRNFHECNDLPSKKYMLEILEQVIEQNKNAIFVVIRQRAYWLELLQKKKVKEIVLTRNPRCSYISKGNIETEAGWIKLKSVLA